MSSPVFTETERKILALTQGTLPDSATPFADIAAAVGATEQEVIDLLSRLKADGTIRRFGATLRHQKAGYAHNAMVAWRVPEGRDADEIGKIMAARPEISHCYRRIRAPGWDFDLYTMIHGTRPGQCLEIAAQISAETGVPDYDVLESVKEMKKTSMKYFE